MKKSLIILPVLVAALSSCSLDNSVGYSVVENKYTYENYAKHSMYMSVCPSAGDSKILVIPVWFTDSGDYINPANRDKVRDDIELSYFGTSEETGWESVKSYYEKDSFGHAKMDGVVTDWYECNKPSSDFYTDGNATAELIFNSVKWYKSKYEVSNMKDFDKNKDGFIDGVMIIYGAPDYLSLNDRNKSNLWAYTSWLGTNASPFNPTVNAFFWASYDFMYSEETAIERTGITDYGRGDTRYCEVDAHTFIHEMGHVFGLSDYYDYGGVSAPAGAFSMQDYNVGAHDPYSRLSLGWATPIVPYKTTTITVKPVEESGEIVVLSPEYTGSPFDEYVILELYTPTGLNKFDTDHQYDKHYPVGPSQAGVRVWHVDARLAKAVYSSRDRQWYISEITSVPSSSGYSFVTHATSNTNAGARVINYAGDADYNELELIRNDPEMEYNSYEPLNDDSLFYTGDTFSLSLFQKQFVNGTLLNSGDKLGWEVTFDSVTEVGMTITCRRV